MTDADAGFVRRRRLLRALGASGVATALAGCSGGSDGQASTSDEDGDGSDGGDGTTTAGGGSTESNGDASGSEETATSKATTTDDDDGGLSKESDDSSESGSTGDDGPVTATVRLQISDAKSNVDKFETFRASFERFELTASDGSTVTLDDETRDVDLTEVGEGGTFELFETEIPAGAYEEGTLYLPVQEATLSDGSDPEFEDIVPTSRSVRGDGIEVGGDDPVGFDVRLGLVRVGGDGPWTYTVGWGVGPA